VGRTCDDADVEAELRDQRPATCLAEQQIVALTRDEMIEIPVQVRRRKRQRRADAIHIARRRSRLLNGYIGSEATVIEGSPREWWAPTTRMVGMENGRLKLRGWHR